MTFKKSGQILKELGEPVLPHATFIPGDTFERRRNAFFSNTWIVYRYLYVKLKEKCFFSFFKYGLFMFYFNLSVFGFVDIFVGVMDITLLGRRIK